MSKHTMKVLVPFADDHMEARLTFNYTRGSADYWNGSGGHWEQGYPADVELIQLEPVEPTLALALSAERNPYLRRALDEWADLWLADEGYPEAVEAAEADLEADREYAAESRMVG